VLSFYISAGTTKHLDKHQVPILMFRCEDLLAPCSSNENMKILLMNIPKCKVDVISIDFLFYLNAFLNSGM